jgi:hypothetical protein
MEFLEMPKALRRQMLYPPELRARKRPFPDSKPLPNHCTLTGTPLLAKTVSKPPQFGRTVSELRGCSLALRFNFRSASRFISSFICE